MVEIADEIKQQYTPTPATNGPGRPDRANLRAPGIDRENPVRPRKLGHVVVGSIDQDASHRFFRPTGLGFKITDHVPGLASFMRCSTDHHNVLVQQAPLNFLHHTAWEVDDVDEVGRGATAMLEGHPERHVWGLGRHHLGSNFFWYLKDPAGNFSEYYSDIDCIIDEQLRKPGRPRRRQRTIQLGPPAAAVIYYARGPGRPDDGITHRPLTPTSQIRRTAMRIGTLNHRYHALAGNLALDIANASDGRFAPDGFDIFERVRELAGWVSTVSDSAYRPFDTDALGPPVPMPRQAFGIGLNYRDHAAESGLAEPDVPLVFAKFPTSITGPRATVTLPSAYVDLGG